MTSLLHLLKHGHRAEERCARCDKQARDDEIRKTGVRFTVAQLNDMADAFMAGKTPPPLSFNENVLLQALIRQRMEDAP